MDQKKPTTTQKRNTQIKTTRPKKKKKLRLIIIHTICDFHWLPCCWGFEPTAKPSSASQVTWCQLFFVFCFFLNQRVGVQGWGELGNRLPVSPLLSSSAPVPPLSSSLLSCVGFVEFGSVWMAYVTWQDGGMAWCGRVEWGCWWGQRSLAPILRLWPRECHHHVLCAWEVRNNSIVWGRDPLCWGCFTVKDADWFGTSHASFVQENGSFSLSYTRTCSSSKCLKNDWVEKKKQKQNGYTHIQTTIWCYNITGKAQVFSVLAHVFTLRQWLYRGIHTFETQKLTNLKHISCEHRFLGKQFYANKVVQQDHHLIWRPKAVLCKSENSEQSFLYAVRIL